VIVSHASWRCGSYLGYAQEYYTLVAAAPLVMHCEFALVWLRAWLAYFPLEIEQAIYSLSVIPSKLDIDGRVCGFAISSAGGVGGATGAVFGW
jgi:hypothetical protein